MGKAGSCRWRSSRFASGVAGTGSSGVVAQERSRSRSAEPPPRASPARRERDARSRSCSADPPARRQQEDAKRDPVRAAAASRAPVKARSPSSSAEPRSSSPPARRKQNSHRDSSARAATQSGPSRGSGKVQRRSRSSSSEPPASAARARGGQDVKRQSFVQARSRSRSQEPRADASRPAARRDQDAHREPRRAAKDRSRSRSGEPPTTAAPAQTEQDVQDEIDAALQGLLGLEPVVPSSGNVRAPPAPRRQESEQASQSSSLAGLKQKDGTKVVVLDQKRQPKGDKDRMKINLQKCLFCMDSQRFAKEKRQELVISASPRAYVSMDDFSKAVLPGQVCIYPQDHSPSTTDVDEDTWREIRNYQKCLARYFNAQDPPKRLIFAESSIHVVSKEKLLMGAGGHAAVVAYPVDMEVFADARIFFKKAIEESESEWVTQHKKVISTDKKGGVRTAIPKNFPFVHIAFSLEGGFVHIVEEAESFPKDFAQHTIAGMCELTELDRAYRTKEEYKKATEELKKSFKESGFDWTLGLKERGATND